jgi:hypothetical protein
MSFLTLLYLRRIYPLTIHVGIVWSLSKGTLAPERPLVERVEKEINTPNKRMKSVVFSNRAHLFVTYVNITIGIIGNRPAIIDMTSLEKMSTIEGKYAAVGTPGTRSSYVLKPSSLSSVTVFSPELLRQNFDRFSWEIA